jgi:hypothetical protein
MISKPLLISIIFILTFFHAQAFSLASTASKYHVSQDSASGIAPLNNNMSS